MTINNIPHQHMDKPTHTYKLIYFESYVVSSVSYFEQQKGSEQFETHQVLDEGFN